MTQQIAMPAHAHAIATASAQSGAEARVASGTELPLEVAAHTAGTTVRRSQVPRLLEPGRDEVKRSRARPHAAWGIARTDSTPLIAAMAATAASGTGLSTSTSV